MATTWCSRSTRSATSPVRLRNRIVHGYWSIDVAVLHTTAREQLPDFTEDLRQVLNVLRETDRA
jgi:uncharacterized protein with HEPN domain